MQNRKKKTKHNSSGHMIIMKNLWEKFFFLLKIVIPLQNRHMKNVTEYSPLTM